MQSHPWEGINERFRVGEVVSGTVSRIADFGAFVKLAAGIEGLVHVSELAHRRVSVVSTEVSEGQEVNVKILSVDVDAQRIALSIKQTTAAPVKQTRKEVEEELPPRELAVKRSDAPLKVDAIVLQVENNLVSSGRAQKTNLPAFLTPEAS